MLSIQNNGMNITRVTGNRKLIHSGSVIVRDSLSIGASSEEVDDFFVSTHREIPSSFSVFHHGKELTSVDRTGRLVTSGGFMAGTHGSLL